MKLTRVDGQPSWKIPGKGSAAWLTQLGGHLAPVEVTLKGKRVRMPLAMNAWSRDRLPNSIPAIVKVIRGDFFCLPFGLNLKPWRNEMHPVHGEPANLPWKFEGLERTSDAVELRTSLKTTIRPGRIQKTIRLRDHHPAVYCQHVIRGMKGPASFGHHAMLRFPSEAGSGLVSTSPFSFGQVYPGNFEEPAARGYSALKPGAVFQHLNQVADIFGGVADLSRYPAREGFDDLVMVAAKADLPFAWSAVTFPEQGYVWFSLKDPKVLRATVLWHANGGRHYEPWNGRHKHVLGLEEVTANFHYGQNESASPNSLSQKGIKTVHLFTPRSPLVVNYIFALASIPAGLDHVREIRLQSGLAILTSHSGRTTSVPIDAEFLHTEAV